MDTELLRTFLEVRKTRHFARAAANLFVTQAAISARIRQLEEIIGQPLFSRARNNIQLTAAGHQLVPYAESILETWNRALLEAATGEVPLIVIGCLHSLREVYLDNWLLSLLEHENDLHIQLESLSTLEIVSRIRDGSLDLGVVYEAPRAADLWVEKLASFELELVAAHPQPELDGLENFFQVEWGTSLAPAKDPQLGGMIRTRARLDSARLARRLVLALNGCAYLPGPMITEDIAEQRLHRVPGSPKAERTAVLIGPARNRDTPAINDLISALHSLA